MAIDALEQTEKFQNFFETHYTSELHEISSKGRRSLIVDFFELSKFDVGLSEELLEEPDETIKAAEAAVELLGFKARVRFRNFPESQHVFIRNIRKNHISKFIAIEGIIRQSSDVRPEAVHATYECPSCGGKLKILQTDNKLREPSRCSCGRKGHFRLLNKDLVDVQRLVVEESPQTLDGGAQPKRLSVFLREDLVEPVMEKRTTPGTNVKITGVLREVPIPHKQGGIMTRFELSMDSNHIEPVEEDFSDIIIKQEEVNEIKKLASSKKIFEKLTNSIAPSIYGNENVKLALGLQMFSGVRKKKKDGTIIRGDMHILLVGDPGVAKSQMVIFISKVAPKARYVAGRGASGAGLTATVVKDDFLRGWALEAGAMVLADKGILCLDEMDKMSQEDTSALHEAMEQQQISIAKANVQACYSEDTEVLTEKGWKKYSEVKNLKIAQYDPKKRTIQFLKHTGLYIYNSKGKMYHFKNKRTDIFVTPNHKMLLKEIRHKDYQAIKAEEISYSRMNILNSGNFISKTKREIFNLPPIKHHQKRKHPKYSHQKNAKKIPMDLWLEFLGYYLSEGGMETKPTIGITQKEKSNVKKIKKCLSKLSKYVGFTLTEIKNKNYTKFKITNTQLYSYLMNCGHYSYEKKFPMDFTNLSKNQLKILYDSLMLGDGASDGKSYSSSSVELINQFQIIACLIGKSASVNVQYPAKKRGNRRTLYRVTLSDRIESIIQKKQIKIKNYNGKVYCFATKTGFFITRRNGKIAIQGNTLRAQTSILAAANPKLGRFDPYAQIGKQIDLPPALISRFDLIFVLRDLPSKEIDSKIAKHMLMNQTNEGGAEADIDAKLLRKWVAYAKQNIKPRLTDEAKTVIENFYVSLRNSGPQDEAVKPIPITPRQLEAIIRLAEASAKLRLSEKVTKADAERAIKLQMACMEQIGIDPETGKMDIDRVTTGVPSSERGKIISVREIIFELSESKKTIPVEEIMEEAEKKGIPRHKVDESIDKLKRGGDIYEPKKGFIEKIN